MDIAYQIKEELGIRKDQVEAVIRLIDEGNTIPFIARYRKEAHGGLNDEVLRNLDERLRYLRGLEDRKAAVRSSMENFGAMTPEFEAALEKASTLVEVEDLYRPYKPRRRTRAMIAREQGLAPFALLIRSGLAKKSLEEEAVPFLRGKNDSETAPETAADAIRGASDILAEEVADDPDVRRYIRSFTMKAGMLTSEAKDEKAASVYEMYYHYSEVLKRIPGHRVLALNRGEKEKILSLKIEVDETAILRYLESRIIQKPNPHSDDVMRAMLADSYKRLIAPSVENEIRHALTEQAEDGAIHVFGKNLEQLLMQPPITGQVVLGWDPAFRTGCKLAVVDPTGKVLDTVVIYPTAPQNRVTEAVRTVKALIRKYGITLISVGNGTASRESEQIIAQMIREEGLRVRYVITNEAGASVYSASKLATEEFPSFDVGQRSAISIARRLQDPLAELVKIDPKAIGVGQYQHDMEQKKLGETLGGVVEDCVNRVGVDLNTASASLLEYVSGISKPVARNIVAYREENGPFRTRRELLKVAKLGPKAYEQCAGFLRITGGKEPLDATAVHPESYAACEEILKKAGVEKREIAGGGIRGIASKLPPVKKLAGELGIGELTLADLLSELEKPGRDPREEMPKPVLRQDVLDMNDLTVGMILKGTVRNVIDFGAFVDIGVHQDGLVHISEICDRFIKHPLEAVSVGDVVTVKVISVDLKKKRIGLSIKQANG